MLHRKKRCVSTALARQPTLPKNPGYATGLLFSLFLTTYLDSLYLIFVRLATKFVILHGLEVEIWGYRHLRLAYLLT